MALARIFSCSPQQAAALIHDLERQGYKVEVLRPEETPSGPADLEIEYELVENSAMVERAHELAAELHADVAIDVGILHPAVVEAPAEVAPEPRLVESFPETDLEPEEQAEPATIWQESEEAPAYEVNAREAGAQPLEIEQQEIDVPNIAEPIEVHFSPPLTTPDSAEVESVPEPSTPHPLALALKSAGAATIAFSGNLLHTLRGLWQDGLHIMREQRERASIRAVEIRAHREQRMLELTCRRAEALRHSQQLGAARRAASGYLSQLQRETGAHAHEEADPIAPLPSATASPQARKMWRVSSQQVKGIAAGATAAGVLFALTLGISTVRHRPSYSTKPAAPELPSASEQSLQTNVAQSAQVAARPSPAVHKPAPKPAAVSVRPSKASENDDSVADDVVVRHFSQTPHKLQSRASDGVKHYSDSDN